MVNNDVDYYLHQIEINEIEKKIDYLHFALELPSMGSTFMV